MTKYLWAYAGAAALFVVADAIWLGLVARDFYKNQLGGLLADNPVWSVAVAFYLLYLVGLVIFGVSPGLQAGSMMTAVLYGALFGFFAYATYDLTNLATVKNWPVTMSLVDMAWGTVLSGSASAAGYWLASRMGG
jgi:uncharacterized membrane protein